MAPLIDFPWRPVTGRCAATNRPFAPGEPVVSVLVREGEGVVRRDYASEAWPGPAEGSLGWWRREAGPDAGEKDTRPQIDRLLDLLDAWNEDPAMADARYVLAMLLLRRRALRTSENQPPSGYLMLDCPRRSETYRVQIAVPSDERAPLILEWLQGAGEKAA